MIERQLTFVERISRSNKQIVYWNVRENGRLLWHFDTSWLWKNSESENKTPVARKWWIKNNWLSGQVTAGDTIFDIWRRFEWQKSECYAVITHALHHNPKAIPSTLTSFRDPEKHDNQNMGD